MRDTDFDGTESDALGDPPPSDSIEERRVVAAAEAALFGESSAPPARIGRFEVIERLGAGGFGVVYAARDPTLDRSIAIKLLRAGGARETGDADAIVREARAMARLSHPNVVTVHEVGVHEGRPFVAMELVAGRSLRQWMAEARAVDDIVGVFIQAGRGLAAAHDAGLVHRDFKPENVLVSDDGRVLVTDFGLAAPGPVADERLPDASGPEASSLARAGTPAYMAPEQHAGRSAGPAADQFAFCVALYEALWGRRPFPEQELGALVAAKSLGYAERPQPRAGMSRRLWAAVSRGLSPQPTARWPSMRALLDALERDPRSRPLRLAGIAIVTLVLGAALLGAIAQMWMLRDWLGG